MAVGKTPTKERGTDRQLSAGRSADIKQVIYFIQQEAEIPFYYVLYGTPASREDTIQRSVSVIKGCFLSADSHDM